MGVVPGLSEGVLWSQSELFLLATFLPVNYKHGLCAEEDNVGDNGEDLGGDSRD